MVPYQISLEPELVQGLLTRNDGVALLVQSILNQVLQAQVSEHLACQPVRADTGADWLSQRLPRSRVHYWFTSSTAKPKAQLVSSTASNEKDGDTGTECLSVNRE